MKAYTLMQKDNEQENRKGTISAGFAGTKGNNFKLQESDATGIGFPFALSQSQHSISFPDPEKDSQDWDDWPQEPNGLDDDEVGGF